MFRRTVWLLLAATLISAAPMGWYLWGPPGTAAAPQRPPPIIPVTTTVAQRQDVPIFLSGIGTVRAFNFVTVKARVDGHLESIAFVEGQDVTEGDVLAQIDPRPFQAQLAQARAAKARNEAQLANARLDYQRSASLAARDFASKQTVDTQRALVAQLEAAVQGDQATIDNATVQLGYTTILSPITGRTGMRLVDRGNIVRTTDTNGLVVIAQLQPISVIFSLPQDVLPDVTREMSRGPLKVLALNRDSSTKLGEGVLTLVDNQVDPNTATIRLKATFDNKDNALWPGQFVNARLLLATRPDVVIVPTQVVQRGPKGPFAYVVKSDQSVEQRPLKTGYAHQGLSIIEEGLAAGDQVVLDGQYKLRAGTRVQAKPSNKSAKPIG